MRALITSLFAFLAIAAVASAPILPLTARAADSSDLDVIVHPATGVSRLTSVELEALFTRTQTRWHDDTAVVPLNAPTGTPSRDLFDRVVLRLNADQVGRFWLDRRIRGLGLPPRQVPDAMLVLKVVENLRGSIGYVRPELVSPRVKVVAKIRQGRVTAP